MTINTYCGQCRGKVIQIAKSERGKIFYLCPDCNFLWIRAGQNVIFFKLTERQFFALAETEGIAEAIKEAV